MKKIAFLLTLCILCVSLAACGGKAAEDNATVTTAAQTSAETTAAPAVKEDVSVIALKGPTGMGLVDLMSKNDAGEAKENYTFTLASSPDEVTAPVINGEFDIACVPSNLAAVLYKKTAGAVQIAAVNTLGVLYLLENGNTINSVADLAGKTIAATGQGSTPEYILRYILTANGLDPDSDVTIKYYTEHSELAALMASGDEVIGVLPEPNVSVVTSGNSAVRVALDLTAEWDKAAPEGSRLIQGCIIVNKNFAGEHPEALAAFLDEYKSSVDAVNADPAAASALIESYGIVAKAAVALKALPNCNIVYIDGSEMKTALDGFFGVLFAANPASVGGAVPDEGIYYNK